MDRKHNTNVEINQEIMAWNLKQPTPTSPSGPESAAPAPEAEKPAPKNEPKPVAKPAPTPAPANKAVRARGAGISSEPVKQTAEEMAAPLKRHSKSGR